MTTSKLLDIIEENNRQIHIMVSQAIVIRMKCYPRPVKNDYRGKRIGG